MSELERRATANDDDDGPPFAMALAPAALPSMSQQKAFIIDSIAMFSRELKVAIMSLVRMEVGDAPLTDSTSEHAVYVNLDLVEASNPDIVTQIYNMVKARVNALSMPAK